MGMSRWSWCAMTGQLEMQEDSEKYRKMKKSRHKTKMTKLVLERPGKG